MARVAGVMIVIALTACTADRDAATDRSPTTTASPTTTGSPTPSPTPAALTRDDKWRADVAETLDAIVDAHPDPFAAVSEAKLRGMADDLVADVPTLSDDEVVGRLMALVAALGTGNGHSGVFPLAQPGSVLHALPLRLYQFADGTFVVDALPPYRELVGSRVLSIGGERVEDVATRLAPLVPADNAHSRRSRLPLHLVVPELVTTVGGARDMRLRLRSGGRERTVAPVAVPMEKYAEWLGFVSPLVPPSLPARRTDPVPHWLSDQQENFWLRWLPRSRTVYVQYNLVQGATAAGETMYELADRLVAEVGRRRAVRVVVDVRHNPGGENSASAPLLAVLEKLRMPVVLLTGPATFSAAGVFAAKAQADARAVVVGEPTGGAPTLYGDGEPVTLEHSGVVVHVAEQFHETIEGDDRTTIPPDVPVALTAADYFAGRDPVLARALRVR